jgi:hypothetical protein
MLIYFLDQDPAIPVALHNVFPNTIHRLCLWHVQNRFMSFLNELYARFAEQDFKTKFQSIIHHPLTPSEFEATWAMMLDDINYMMLCSKSYMKSSMDKYQHFLKMISVG